MRTPKKVEDLSESQAQYLSRRLKGKGPCEKADHTCRGRIEVHHRDRNPRNVALSNLVRVCRHHHNELHAKMGPSEGQKRYHRIAKLRLTMAERDVAERLCRVVPDGRGLTRRMTLGEIAEDMRLSPHTVRHHLNSLKGKLGVTRRGDIAAAYEKVASGA